MKCELASLIKENAQLGREMRGTPQLRVPQETDVAWRLRRDVLLHSEYPHVAACPEKDVERKDGRAVVVFQESKLQGEPPERTAAQKRSRSDHTAVVSVDPSVLKARASSLGERIVGAAGPSFEPYTAPPSWKMAKVLVGHRGWVWGAAVDPSNSWFATGGGDGVVKVWDLTTGALKLNLTGHKEGVRALSLSTLSPYMFTGSDDHSVKCWDLERNEIIRDFHGHKGSVHCVSTHPSLDIVLSGGRDKTVRVWDVRTRSCVHLLLGHSDSVMSLAVQQEDPQAISGGSDGMVYLWDIASGRAFTRLTRHKKPVRGLALSRQRVLVSCGADNIRVWSLPTGEFLFNASTLDNGKETKKEKEQEPQRWSCCSVSPRNVLAVGSQEGRLLFFDWSHPQQGPYQATKTRSVPGTLPGEGGINGLAFDASGSRLITAESDKSAKVWRTKE
ncbi:putative WD40 repeat protein [Trypanosoma equiperdum]|uniref:Uncharacterized protein n=2 Tax=Trypanozoon TaxID=39700 RepID=Q389W0_TRYB2|nr:hypothetical protein, conserved [Trypanosoma brucei brucei TREU927]EAN78410.1 hypothetical protein, conserved [Trypanosoma brucei brucei TREU927]SCU67982.1 predicted WD40 repeat protein [Trypanosoma equiperdum]